jgi:hypothetical protein
MNTHHECPDCCPNDDLVCPYCGHNCDLQAKTILTDEDCHCCKCGKDIHCPHCGQVSHTDTDDKPQTKPCYSSCMHCYNKLPAKKEKRSMLADINPLAVLFAIGAVIGVPFGYMAFGAMGAIMAGSGVGLLVMLEVWFMVSLPDARR